MTPPAAPPRVLIVDDHAVVRLGVRALLGDRVLLREADTLEAARSELAREPAELLLLDLALGPDFGLAAIPRLREQWPAMRILVLTSLDETMYAERVLRAGADGYVMKTALTETLWRAAQAVLGGEVYVSEALRSTLLRRLSRPTPAGGAGAAAALSARETEVLRLVARGLSTREIAETLNRSVKTIETHKQALKLKLDADSPAMLVRKAVAWFGEHG